MKSTLTHRLLLALALTAVPALRAETIITGSMLNYIMSGTETEYVIDADAQIYQQTTAIVLSDTTDAVSRKLTIHGAVGNTAYGNPPYPNNTPATTPVIGILFSSTGYAEVYNHGNIIMGDGAGAAGLGARYAVRFNNTTGSLGGALYNDGFIFSAFDGVQSWRSAPFTLVNTGTILAVNRTPRDPTERGVLIDQGGPVYIENSGLISAGGAGVSFHNTGYNTAEGFHIVNSGTIESTRTDLTAGMATTGSSGAAITIGRVSVAGSSGTITNTGLLKSPYSSVFNTGTVNVRNNGGQIEGAVWGIISIANANQVAPSIQIDNNAGVITGGSAAINIATGTGMITNTSGGLIEGAIGAGIVLAGASATVLNDASEIRGATHGISVTSEGSTITNRNGGLIEGASGIFATTGMHVVNTGTIRATGAQIASVYFAGINASESSLTLGTGSVLEGDVLSAKAAGNRLFLEGDGSADNNFIGVDSTGAFDAANGFESLTMNGSAWTLSGTISITGSAADALTINSGTLTIAGDLLMPNNAGVTLSGGDLALDLAGDGAFGSAISGSGAFVHAGAGLVDLTGVNTYTGQTIVNTGTLKGSIGASALHLVTAVATYVVDPTATSVTLGNISGIGIVDIQNANLAFDVQGATTVQTYDFAGTLTGGSGNKLVKTGDGKFILTQSLASSLNGGTEVHEGTLSLSDVSHISSAGISLGGAATAGFIEYTGAGEWSTAVTLDGAGGGFFVGSGTQALTATVGGAGAFMKDGAGALDIRNATFGAGVNTTEIRAGELIASHASLAGDVNLASAVATLIYEHSGATAATDNRAISGSGNLIKTGDGLLNLTGNITHAGNTIVREGTLQGNIGTGGLQVDSGATYKVADGITNFQLSGITGNGTVDLNAANLVLDVAAGLTDVFNFSGNLVSSSSDTKLIKTGAGTTELLSSAVFQGGIAVQEGLLRLANQALIATPVVLGTGTTFGFIEYTGAAAWAHNITLSGNGGGFSVASGTQAISGFSINGAGDFVKAGAGTLDITAANITDTANGSMRVIEGTLRATTAVLKAGGIEIAAASVIDLHETGDAVYAGAITGPGTLIKTGTGALALTGANAYGDTFIQSGLLSGNIGAGILAIASSGTYRVADGATDFTLSGVQGNGTIDLAEANLVFDVASGTSSFSFSGVLRGGNQLVKTGSGALQLQSAVALAGGAAVQDGLLIVADPALLRSPVELGTATTVGMLQHTGLGPWNNTIVLKGLGGGFFVAAGATTNADGAIRSSDADARFIKTGAGTLDVTTATFDGVTGAVAEAGTLRGRSATLPRKLEALSGATIELYETDDATWDGMITGEGRLLKTGAGTLTIEGALQQTGMLVLARGIMKLGHSAALSDTAHVSIAAGATFDLGRRDQTLANLDNNGAIHLDATVNSRTGKILEWNTLKVTGTAAGSGLILVRLEENDALTPSAITSATLVATATNNNYTAQLAERSVYGPYDWMLSKIDMGDTGTIITLRPGMISPEVAAAGGIDVSTHLLGRASLAALGSRLMGARDGGMDHTFQIWAGYMGREDKLKSDLYDGAKARTSGLQVGAEWNAAKAGGSPVVIGFYTDQGTSDFEMPGRVSESTTKTRGLGAYVSYRTKPLYADLILRNARENYDVTITYAGQRHTFGTEGHSMAASLEIGSVVSGDLPWCIEPQLQAVYQRHRIDTFTDTMGRDIDIATRDSIEGRAGVRVSRAFGGGDSFRFTPHLRASIVHEANENGAVNFIRGDGITDPVAFRHDLGGTMGMVDAGVLLQWEHGFRLQATAAWYGGSRMDGLSLNVFAAFSW